MRNSTKKIMYFFYILLFVIDNDLKANERSNQWYLGSVCVLAYFLAYKK